MSETKEMPGSVARGANSYKCTCGGYCERVKSTKAERAKYGCGRSYDCCNVAFICAICGTRWVGCQDAPEMEW